MDPEQGGEGGGGMMQSRIFGIPTIVWVGGIALIVYFLFFRNSQGSANTGADQTSGGGGTITTGNTTIDTGAVQVSVTADNGAGNTQPSPPTTGGTTTVAVPNLIGAPGAAAVSRLSALGLKSTRTPPPSVTGKKATDVTSEKPKAGTKVRKGSVVHLGVKTENERK